MRFPPSYFEQYAKQLIAECVSLMSKSGDRLPGLHRIKAGLDQAVAEIEESKARATDGSAAPIITAELVGKIDNLQCQLTRSR